MIGFDVKKAAKLIRAAAKKDRVFVMRDENNVLAITDGVIVLRGSEQDLWEVAKVLPSPVPPDAGTYLYEHGNAATKAGLSLSPVINQAIRQATKCVEDTFITLHEGGRDLRILVPCDGQGEYAAMQEKFHEVFAATCDYRQGEKGNSPVVAYRTDTEEVAGLALPLTGWSCRFLRPLDSASPPELATDDPQMHDEITQ